MIRQWINGILDNRLIFAVLLLLKISWTLDGKSLDLPEKLQNSNEIAGDDGSIMEMEIGVSTDAETLQYYLTHWNESITKGSKNSVDEQSAVYYGEGLSDLFFQSSANNSSLILSDLSRCLKDFWITTCLKLLLLSRLDNILGYLKDNNLTSTDFSFMNGLLTFKREQIREPGTNLHCKRKFGENGMLGLDEDITTKLMELFEDRILRLNLLPGLAIDLISTPGKTSEDFIDFKAKPHFRWKFWQTEQGKLQEHRESSPRKKSKGGFRMPSMMMIPQLIMWGFMPFALANLQAMVMNAFMMNMMALNSAIFMTIRNLVFGPRGGPKIKYVNYGYRKKMKSNVPTLIIHSPAAFVKQPFHRSSLLSAGNEHFEPKHKAFQYSNPVRHRSVPQHYRGETPATAEFDYSRASEELSLSKPQNNPDALSEEYHNTGYDNFESLDNRRNGELDKGIQVMKMTGLLDGKKRFRIRLKSGSVRSMKELLRRIREIEELRKSNMSTEKSEKPRHKRKFGSRRTKITNGYRNQSYSIRNYLGNQNDAQEHDSSHSNDGYRIALDQSASHVSGERKISEMNTKYEVKNFAINYDRTGFKPMKINRDGQT